MAVGIAFGVVLWAAFVGAISHRTMRSTKRVILKHLARDGEYVIRVGYAVNIWNPQQSHLPKSLFSGAYDQEMAPGRGIARYSSNVSMAM
jgi:hypothetical protein